MDNACMYATTTNHEAHATDDEACYVLSALSTFIVPKAVTIAALLVALEDTDSVGAASCIARSMAIIYVTHIADIRGILEGTPLRDDNVLDDKDHDDDDDYNDDDDGYHDDDDDDNISDGDGDDDLELDIGHLMAQLYELERRFDAYEPTSDLEREVVGYIRDQLLETNTGTASDDVAPHDLPAGPLLLLDTASSLRTGVHG